MGPTAAGKTDLAIRLVEMLQQSSPSITAEIISVDSALVYRGMDIGTGKPSPEQMEKIPHHLIDIRDPSESYSAAEFCSDALHCMHDITARGKIPILAGGTFLYFSALLTGLSSLPSADPMLRKKLQIEAETLGPLKMFERLQAVDPITAARIHPNDPQRIHRALEVYEITGKPMSEFLERNASNNSASEYNTVSGIYPHNLDQQYHLFKFALVPRNRAYLHQRIEARFHKMLELGLIEEVLTLFHRGDLHINLPSMRAVGYRQIWERLGSDPLNPSITPSSIADCLTPIILAATRQLAKRQLTWLRNSRIINQNTIFFEIERDIETNHFDSLQTMVNCVS